MSPDEDLEKTSLRPTGSVAPTSPHSALLKTFKGLHGDHAKARLGLLPSMVSTGPEPDLTATIESPSCDLLETTNRPAPSRTENGADRDRPETCSSPALHRFPLVHVLVGESMVFLRFATAERLAVLTPATDATPVGRRTESAGSVFAQAARAAAPGGPRTIRELASELSYGVKTTSCPAPRRDRPRRTRTYGGVGSAGLRSRRGPAHPVSNFAISTDQE